MRKRIAVELAILCSLLAFVLGSQAVVQAQFPPDIGTQLSYFLADLASGNLGATRVFTTIYLGGTTAAFPRLRRNGTRIAIELADGSGGAQVDVSSMTATAGYAMSGGSFFIGANNVSYSTVAPTISSGFGTSPSIATNGTLAFDINVGTGGVATSGVVGLTTATTGWVCQCWDITTTSATVFITKQTASSTTTCTIGNFNTSAASAAWNASDHLRCQATAY